MDTVMDTSVSGRRTKFLPLEPSCLSLGQPGWRKAYPLKEGLFDVVGCSGGPQL